MANGAFDDDVLRIGPLVAPPAPGRGGRYCGEASLILAVLGLMCTFVGEGFHGDFRQLAIVGVLCMTLALALALIGRRQGGEAKVIANFALLMSCPTIFLLCLIPSHGGAHAAARRAQFSNNMKQVGLALNDYRQAHGRFPPAVVRDPQGRPLYSWRVLILPYLDDSSADSLYREFHFNERWDSPHNRSLLAKIPQPYQGVGVDGDRELTFIQAFVGPGSAFESPVGEPLDNPDGSPNFPDGVERTILAVEAREGVPWSAPYDLYCGLDMPPTALGGGFRRDRGLMERQAEIKGFNILLADGSVKWVKYPIPPANLRALITRNANDQYVNEPFD